jgi:hypothetical protein
MIETISQLVGLIKTGGVEAVLVIIVVALAFWIVNRTVPKEIYDQQADDLDDVRSEMHNLVGPALDRLTTLQSKQIELQEEVYHRLDNHTNALNDLSREVRIISHELTMQRLQSPKHKQAE